MRQRIFSLFFGCALLLAACSGGGITGGAESTGARSFTPGQCFVTYNETVSVFTQPDTGAIPVGQGSPGRFEMQAVQTLDGGGLFYQSQEGLWVRLDGVAHTTEGDCAAPE